MEVAGKVLETYQVRTDSKPCCEVCAIDNVTRSANCACRECNEYMCDDCFKDHIKGKACRGHVKITVDELPAVKTNGKGRDVEKCQKHNDELIKFYCRTHDVIGCGDCVILEHTNCKPEYIRDIAKSIRTDSKFKPLFTKIDEFEKKKSEGKKNMQRMAQEIDSLKKNALDEVRKFRTEINVYCDKAEAEIVSTVDRLTSENRQLKKNMEQEIRKLTTDIEEIQKSFSDPEQSESVTFIQVVSHKSMIEAISPRFEKIRNTKDIRKFQFFREKEFSDILKSTSKFGRIHVDATPTTTDQDRKQVGIASSLGYKPGRAYCPIPVIRATPTTTDQDRKQVGIASSLGYKPGRAYCPIPVIRDLRTSDFTKGTRVRRGPDWDTRVNQTWTFCDEDEGGPGTVISITGDWARVKWDAGRTNSYRIGANNSFDLSIIQ